MMRSRTARTALAAFAVASTVAALTGCSQSGDTGEDGDVTLEYFNFSASPDHETQLETIVDAFEKENPGISIDVKYASFDEFFTQLQTRIAGGTAPDTFELNYENFVSFASSGALLDLGDDVDASVYAEQPYNAFTYDGKQYGLPESFSDVVLAYNKTLFDAAGVDYPTREWTWADRTAAAEAITDEAAGVYGDWQPVTFFEFYKALAQNGGEFFNDDVTEATFNSPEGVEAAEWLIDKVGNTMPTEAQLGGQGETQLFQSGKLAMMNMGIWAFTELSEMGDWDVQVEPGNTQPASQFFANAAVASATTEHPEEAAKWLEFLTSSDIMVQERLDSSWELPAIADQSLVAPYLESDLPPVNRQAVFDALDDIIVPPVVKRQQELQDTVTQELQQALQGNKSVQQALDDAVDKVNGLL